MITIYTKHINSKRERLVLKLLYIGTYIHTALYRARKPWNLRVQDLARYENNTLGKELYHFYKREQFEPITKAEHHDVFHILLGSDTGVKNETEMQFLLLGNGKRSPFTLGCCLISLFLFPEYFQSYLHHFKKGKNAIPFTQHHFLSELNTPVHTLRNLFNLK